MTVPVAADDYAMEVEWTDESKAEERDQAILKAGVVIGIIGGIVGGLIYARPRLPWEEPSP